MKWFYEMTPEEIRRSRPKDIIIGFDRLDRKPITMDVLYVVRPEEIPTDLNRKEQKYK